jgi:ATP-binding cassette subfamily B protein
LRLLEPLGARETESIETADKEPFSGPVSIAFEEVSLAASGHVILENVSAVVPKGAHIAIVGASGAGKSSLVGALLGWHRPSSGRILVDGAPLDTRLEALRRATAWVDPAVQLWNRALIENLAYGSARATESYAPVLDAADLHGVLEGLPDGLQTVLGEGGALVSGGEGQRVRLGRGLLRADASLVILDEPFRGLDRTTRKTLLQRSREWWKNATLLCVTHDVAETLAFDRVLVIDGGKLVEDGKPEELAARDGSVYRALLDAERAVHEELWADAAWRRCRVAEGAVQETQARRHLREVAS